MEASNTGKKTKGRQRIEIKKLENKNSLEVAFSKRKKGIFNKASELSLLCGAQVAIIIMSPNNRPFSYGHPSVKTLLDRFFSGNNESSEFSTNNEAFDTIKHEIDRLQDQFEEEEKIAKEIKHRNETNDHNWWEQQRVDDMGLDELEQFVNSLEQLRSNVAARVNKEENNDLAIVAKSDGVDHLEARIVDPLTNHSVVNDVAPLNFFFDDGNFFDNMDIGGLI
ncbi:hypothetical protein Pint_29336 [Pistacia integerrima]|uniref:Uncharacterized protein n=1 Tax=Pistacia integerrima TaxID=434235 RepID=A0ACC0WYK3_9ROSI|nr:hypothetical protein Pint_29336 [Pistacia integerrima]